MAKRSNGKKTQKTTVETDAPTHSAEISTYISTLHRNAGRRILLLIVVSISVFYMVFLWVIVTFSGYDIYANDVTCVSMSSGVPGRYTRKGLSRSATAILAGSTRDMQSISGEKHIRSTSSPISICRSSYFKATTRNLFAFIRDNSHDSRLLSHLYPA